MNKKKKSILILFILIVILSSVLLLLLNGFINIGQSDEISISIDKTINTDNQNEERKLWSSNKKFNDDYIGEIIFDSNLVNKSFVQAKGVYDKNGKLYKFYTETGRLVSDPEGYCGNDVYIYTNWKDMSYDYNIEGGSIFMDYRNDLDDQNIIIYGHHFSIAGGNDPERVKAFTPLDKLLEEENYKTNSELRLVLENEIRYYQLASVYIYDIDDDFYFQNMQYYRPTYNYDDFANETNENYYQNYINCLGKVQLYDTGVKLDTSDKTLTLQTCIGGKPSQRQICVFKLIDTKVYSN